MSDFEYNTGYFYPLNEEEYKYLNDVDFFGNYIVQYPFYLECFGHNKYLVLSQTHSYGIENHEFGNSRPLTDNESNLVPIKFSNEFTKIKFHVSKFKFVEYCYYNSCDCKDYYLEGKPKQSEFMTIEQAIIHAKEVAASKCDECGKEHAQLAEWLQELVDLRIKIKRLGIELRAKHLKAIHTANELAAYKDETPITEEWLQANGFNEGGWMKIGDNIIRCYETGRARWFACVDNDDRNFHDKFDRVKTVGQLRMFLTLCGLGDFVKQLKS